MHNRHPDITHHTLCLLCRHNINKHLPTLLIQIQFQKMIQTAIPRDFELRTDAEGCAAGFGDRDGADDAVAVGGEVEGPLV